MGKSRVWFGMLLVLVAGMSLLGGQSGALAQPAKKPVVFALIEPLSGPFKETGTETASYVEYAVEQINAKGGLLGQPVKLLKLDNQMKPDVAVRVAKKAITEDGAQFLMNNTSSAVGLALSKVAMEQNVIYATLPAIGETTSTGLPSFATLRRATLPPLCIESPSLARKSSLPARGALSVKGCNMACNCCSPAGSPKRARAKAAFERTSGAGSSSSSAVFGGTPRNGYPGPSPKPPSTETAVVYSRLD